MRVFDVRFLIADDFRSEEYAQSARKTTVCDLRLSPPVAVVDVAAGVASWDVRVFCRMGSSVGAESSRYGFENDMHWGILDTAFGVIVQLSFVGLFFWVRMWPLLDNIVSIAKADWFAENVPRWQVPFAWMSVPLPLILNVYWWFMIMGAFLESS